MSKLNLDDTANPIPEMTTDLLVSKEAPAENDLLIEVSETVRGGTGSA